MKSDIANEPIRTPREQGEAVRFPGGRPAVRVGIRVALILAAALAVLPGTAHGGEGDAPRAVVRETTDSVIAVLRQEGLPSDDKRRRIEEIVYARFDFDTLSRLVLARNWKELSPEQQREFVEQFREHLSLTYGRNVETYNDEEVVITGDRAEARGDWTVKTKIARPGAEDILVDYRLREKDGRWRMIDVVIEGISLVANYRTQFQQIISRQGPAKLIDMLRDKNAKKEPLKS